MKSKVIEASVPHSKQHAYFIIVCVCVCGGGGGGGGGPVPHAVASMYTTDKFKSSLTYT